MVGFGSGGGSGASTNIDATARAQANTALEQIKPADNTALPNDATVVVENQLFVTNKATTMPVGATAAALTAHADFDLFTGATEVNGVVLSSGALAGAVPANVSAGWDVSVQPEQLYYDDGGNWKAATSQTGLQYVEIGPADTPLDLDNPPADATLYVISAGAAAATAGTNPAWVGTDTARLSYTWYGLSATQGFWIGYRVENKEGGLVEFATRTLSDGTWKSWQKTTFQDIQAMVAAAGDSAHADHATNALPSPQTVLDIIHTYSRRGLWPTGATIGNADATLEWGRSYLLRTSSATGRTLTVSDIGASADRGQKIRVDIDEINGAYSIVLDGADTFSADSLQAITTVGTYEFVAMTNSRVRVRRLDSEGAALLDEDDFASDSDTQGATQQSIHRYVDRRDAYLSQLGNIRQGMRLSFHAGNARTVKMTGGTFLDWNPTTHQADPHVIAAEDPLTFSYIMSDGTVPALDTGVVPDAINTSVITNLQRENAGAVANVSGNQEIAHRLYIHPLTGDKQLLLAQHQWSTSAELVQKIQTEEVVVPAALAGYEYVAAIMVSQSSTDYFNNNNTGILHASEFGSVTGSGGTGSAELAYEPYQRPTNGGTLDVGRRYMATTESFNTPANPVDGDWFEVFSVSPALKIGGGDLDRWTLTGDLRSPEGQAFPSFQGGPGFGYRFVYDGNSTTWEASAPTDLSTNLSAAHDGMELRAGTEYQIEIDSANRVFRLPALAAGIIRVRMANGTSFPFNITQFDLAGNDQIRQENDTVTDTITFDLIRAGELVEFVGDTQNNYWKVYRPWLINATVLRTAYLNGEVVNDDNATASDGNIRVLEVPANYANDDVTAGQKWQFEPGTAAAFPFTFPSITTGADLLNAITANLLRPLAPEVTGNSVTNIFNGGGVTYDLSAYNLQQQQRAVFRSDDNTAKDLILKPVTSFGKTVLVDGVLTTPTGLGNVTVNSSHVVVWQTFTDQDAIGGTTYIHTAKSEGDFGQFSQWTDYRAFNEGLGGLTITDTDVVAGISPRLKASHVVSPIGAGDGINLAAGAHLFRFYVKSHTTDTMNLGLVGNGEVFHRILDLTTGALTASAAAADAGSSTLTVTEWADLGAEGITFLVTINAVQDLAFRMGSYAPDGGTGWESDMVWLPESGEVTQSIIGQALTVIDLDGAGVQSTSLGVLQPGDYRFTVSAMCWQNATATGMGGTFTVTGAAAGLVATVTKDFETNHATNVWQTLPDIVIDFTVTVAQEYTLDVAELNSNDITLKTVAGVRYAAISGNYVEESAVIPVEDAQVFGVVFNEPAANLIQTTLPNDNVFRDTANFTLQDGDRVTILTTDDGLVSGIVEDANIGANLKSWAEASRVGVRNNGGVLQTRSVDSTFSTLQRIVVERVGAIKNVVQPESVTTLYNAANAGGIFAVGFDVADLGFELQPGDEIMLQMDIGLAKAVWTGSAVISCRLEPGSHVANSPNTILFNQVGTMLRAAGTNTNGTRQWLKVVR